MTDIPSLLVRQRDAHDAASFLESGTDQRVLTYRRAADEIAAAMQLLGEEAASVERIALRVGDPLTFAIWYFAVVGSGRCAVPLDPRAPESDAIRQVRAVDAQLLLHDGEAVASIACHRLSEFDPEVPVAPVQADNRLGTRRGEPGAVLLSSSGTTGEPKKIKLGEEQLLHTAGRVVSHHGIGPGDRGLCPLPLFHINAEVVGLLSTLIAGATLVLPPRFLRQGFWEQVRDRDITWINGVPAIIGALNDHTEDPTDVSKVRFMRSASAPLPPSTQTRFTERFGIPVLVSYGMTEAASQITATQPESQAPTGSVGFPVGVDLQVRDEAGEPVEPGQIGMVSIRGEGVISAYQSTVGNENFDAGGWLSTGDLGFQDDDGALHLVSRADDAINRGGEMVFPAEVEDVMQGHPQVVAAALVARADQRLGQVPIACLVLAADANPEGVIADLTLLCEQQLSRYKRPADYAVIDELPSGPTGKVQHKRLASLMARRDGS